MSDSALYQDPKKDSDKDMVMKCEFPPGTVVRFADECGGDRDRSCRVVCDWDKSAGTVRMKHTVNPDEAYEIAKTSHLVIIGWCDEHGEMSWAAD